MTFSPAFLARYDVQRRIGAGGMGEVFLARELALDRPVAIKTVLAAQLASEDAKARFLREARITGSLSHPCIVKVLDQGEDDGRLYIVFDFVEGSDLGRRLAERGALTPADFFALAVPIADAVAHAHAAGVLHRDIKADNVLLDRQGNPRLADFGLAKGGDAGDVKTVTGTLMGTPRYMAPELANGGRATAATDQYALGVLLYEMLAGLPPFDAPQPMAILRMHCDVAPTALSNYRTDVPHALETLVHRALAKSAAERFPDVAALRDALQELEATAPAWTPRAAAGGATVLAPADAPANLDASTARVRRGSGRIPVPGAPRTGTNTVQDAPRASGRVRVPTGKIPVPPAASPSRGPLIAATIIALTLFGAFFAARRFRTDPRYASLKFQLERGRRAATLRWELPATLTAKRAADSPASPFTSASATLATSLALPDLGLADVTLDVELTDPQGTRHAFKGLKYPAVTLESLESELARIRTVPGSEPRTDEEKAWPIEDRLTHRFTLALNTTFGHPPSRIERYSAPQDSLKLALTRSGLDRALDWYRENRLESLLEQAAALIGEPGGDWKLKGQILRAAHAIANVEAFLLTSGLSVPCPALRFQYGLAPGKMPGPTRPVLDGPGDFARANWYSKLLHNDHEVKSAHLSLKEGLEGKWYAKAVEYQLAAKQLKPRLHDPVGGLLAAANSDEGFPPEYKNDGIGTGWSQMVLEPITLTGLKLDPPPPGMNVTGAAVLLHLRAATELTHVDISIGTALLFCFRTPPGYVTHRDIHAWGPDVRPEDLASSDPILSSSDPGAGKPRTHRPGLVHLARFDAAALAAGVPVISIHCARGDGLLDKPTYWMPSWKTFVSTIGVRYEQTSAGSPGR